MSNKFRKSDKCKRSHNESAKTLILFERGSVKKRTKSILEIERSLVFKVPKDLRWLWCDGCGKEVRMMTAELAAMLVGTNSSTIREWIAAGWIHTAETPTG